MNPPHKDNNVNLIEKKPVKGLFSFMRPHRILLFHEKRDITYTKDASMLVKILVLSYSLQNDTSIFCGSLLYA